MSAWLMVLWMGGVGFDTGSCYPAGCSVAIHQFVGSGLTGGSAGVRCNAALTEITKASQGRVRGVCVQV